MTLFILVSILSELLLALMGRNFPKFAFSSAGHIRLLGSRPRLSAGKKWILFNTQVCFNSSTRKQLKGQDGADRVHWGLPIISVLSAK
jgi:hypothetical protein